MIDFDNIFETELERIDKKINEIEDTMDANHVAIVADYIVNRFDKHEDEQSFLVERNLVASLVGFACGAQPLFKEQGLTLIHSFLKHEDIHQWYKEMQGVERAVGKSPFSIYYEAFMLAPDELKQAATKSVADNIARIIDCD